MHFLPRILAPLSSGGPIVERTVCIRPCSLRDALHSLREIQDRKMKNLEYEGPLEDCTLGVYRMSV